MNICEFVNNIYVYIYIYTYAYIMKGVKKVINSEQYIKTNNIRLMEIEKIAQYFLTKKWNKLQFQVNIFFYFGHLILSC